MKALDDVLSSKALARLVVHFLVHPDERLHLRALQRHTGLGMRSLQRELRKLEDWGVVRREEEDGRVYHHPDFSHTRWEALRKVVRAFALPEELIDEALADLRKSIQCAFIYGSVARGEDRPDSDLDLFVVSDQVSRTELSRNLMDAAVAIGRTVNVDLHSPAELQAWSRTPSSYLRSVLSGDKRWVIGEGEEPTVPVS